MSMTSPSNPMSVDRRFVSRGGAKLEHALDAFSLDATGLECADFGCNVGGFTDCLLQRGARRVHAIDTGYGALAWTLRNDERVVVMERTNAMHADPPAEGVDLVVVDLGWTPQRHAIPAALRWLRRGADGAGRIVTLVKPHYEISQVQRRAMLRRGRLEPADAERVVMTTLDALRRSGVNVNRCVQSPIAGDKAGNLEWLALVEPRVAV